MNAVKIFIIGKVLLHITLAICITFASCYFNKWGLLFFLILPACGLSMEVSSENPKNSEEIKSEEDKS